VKSDDIDEDMLRGSNVGLVQGTNRNLNDGYGDGGASSGGEYEGKW
jgi:hypothetical protein